MRSLSALRARLAKLEEARPVDPIQVTVLRFTLAAPDAERLAAPAHRHSAGRVRVSIRLADAEHGSATP